MQGAKAAYSAGLQNEQCELLAAIAQPNLSFFLHEYPQVVQAKGRTLKILGCIKIFT